MEKQGCPPARFITIIVVKHGRVSPPHAAATAAPTFFIAMELTTPTEMGVAPQAAEMIL